MITVTDKAKERLVALRQEEGRTAEHNIRVSVKGGGCSGLMYDLGFRR
jgi:iron-sulfur cluster assembly protein